MYAAKTTCTCMQGLRNRYIMHFHFGISCKCLSFCCLLFCVDKSTNKSYEKLKEPLAPSAQQKISEVEKVDKMADEAEPSEEKGVSPEKKGVSPEKKGVSPEKKDVSSEENCVSAEEKGVSPKEIVLVEEKGVSVEEKGVSPKEIVLVEEKGVSVDEKGDLTNSNHVSDETKYDMLEDNSISKAVTSPCGLTPPTSTVASPAHPVTPDTIHTPSSEKESIPSTVPKEEPVPAHSQEPPLISVPPSNDKQSVASRDLTLVLDSVDIGKHGETGNTIATDIVPDILTAYVPPHHPILFEGTCVYIHCTILTRLRLVFLVVNLIIGLRAQSPPLKLIQLLVFNN